MNTWFIYFDDCRRYSVGSTFFLDGRGVVEVLQASVTRYYSAYEVAIY